MEEVDRVYEFQVDCRDKVLGVLRNEGYYLAEGSRNSDIDFIGMPEGCGYIGRVDSRSIVCFVKGKDGRKLARFVARLEIK